MKVLLAAKYVPSGPRPMGGVQSWVLTVRTELERLGHEVTEWQPTMKLEGRFDLGILANMRLTRSAKAHCKETVCVSHGIIPDEAPGDADRVMFVSEGVRRHWRMDGEIIRQPIDVDFWSPTGEEKAGLVRFSYRKTETLCQKVATLLEEKYHHVYNVSPEGAVWALSRAKVVFASGRAALEAMAVGAPVVIYDHRASYQGPLMDTDIQRQMLNSYSGRGGINPTVDQLVVAYWAAKENRAHVMQHHDVRKIVPQLIGVDKQSGMAA